MEILLVHPGGLGDIILSLPAVALLRQKFPAARFTLAANLDHMAALTAGYAERVASLSALPLHRLYLQDEVPQQDASFWNGFNLVVSWTGAGDPDFLRNLKQIHPNSLVAPWRPGPGESRHVAQIFADSLISVLGETAVIVPAKVLLAPETRQAGLQRFVENGFSGSEAFVAMHPGAGSLAKRWLLDRFIALGRSIVSEGGRKLLLIEGPAESGLAAQVAQSLPPAEVMMAEALPLDATAALLERCEAFVGNDSGIAHLAAALQVPSTVLFGPTEPRHWAPLGDHVTILRNTGGCEACLSGTGVHHCLENITVEEVIQTLKLPS